ncbi:MAG: DUF3426 domain-containing protein [Luteimonas sp.]
MSCPHCQSLVAVDAVTDAAPDFCPYCDGAIGGGATEMDSGVQLDLQEGVFANTVVPASASTDSPAPAIDVPVDDEDRASDGGSEVDAHPTDNTPAQAPQRASAAQNRPKRAHPSFARRSVAAEAATHRARWPWPVAACLLLLLLLQLMVADRASIAAHPRWRARILSVCAALRCDIPPWREVGAFTMLARDVHAHPATADALLIRAAFRNDARWPQPWPLLVLTLSDASGRVTGSRTFTANEYLGGAPTQKLIATGQTAAVALEIEEPVPDTVSFSFDFR